MKIDYYRIPRREIGRWLRYQRNESQPLVRPLRVVPLMLPSRPSQAPRAQDGESADTPGQHGPDPAPDLGIEVGRVDEQAHGLHSRAVRDLRPGWHETWCRGDG